MGRSAVVVVTMTVAAAIPEWYYEFWEVEDWLRTLFDQPLEVHTFVLGLLVGALLATLVASRRSGMALALTLVVVSFTFGAFEPVYGCADEYVACQHVRLKPWYFLGGFLAAHLGGLGVGRLLRDVRIDLHRRTRPAVVLAGAALLVLVALAVSSVVSPWLVHPITGLATLGGLGGAALGLVAAEWVDSTDRAGPEALARAVFVEAFEHAVFVLGYGAVLGFGYPRLFWELGQLGGQEGFLLGPLVRPLAGWLSVFAYVGAIFLVSLLVRRRWLRGGPAATTVASTETDREPRSPSLLALVAAHACYGLCLFLATGLASGLWFQALVSRPT